MIPFAEDDLAPHCETCAHWTLLPLARHHETFHACLSPKFLFQYSPGGVHLAADDVAIMTGEGEGLLCPGPKFGCCHWAAKEEQA
jgi:hypothetical protein